MAKKTATNEGSPEGATTTQQTGAAASPPDLSAPNLQAAVQTGHKVIAEGGTKADSARAMYAMIADEPKETVVAVFVAGATLTDKGALTYWYNCKRKAAKALST